MAVKKVVNTAVNGKLPLTVGNPIHNRLYIIINFKIYRAMLPTLTDSWVTWPYWHWPCPVTLILILITGICPDLDDLDQTWLNPALIRMAFLREWIWELRMFIYLKIPLFRTLPFTFYLDLIPQFDLDFDRPWLAPAPSRSSPWSTRRLVRAGSSSSEELRHLGQRERRLAPLLVKFGAIWVSLSINW